MEGSCLCKLCHPRTCPGEGGLLGTYRLNHGFCVVTRYTQGGQLYGPRAVQLTAEGISCNAQKPWFNQFVATIMSQVANESGELLCVIGLA